MEDSYTPRTKRFHSTMDELLNGGKRRAELARKKSREHQRKKRENNKRSNKKNNMKPIEVGRSLVE